MAANRKTPDETFEVTRSFANLNEGDRFTADPGDEWVGAHAAAGLLRVVTDGDGAGQAGEG